MQGIELRANIKEEEEQKFIVVLHEMCKEFFDDFTYIIHPNKIKIPHYKDEVFL